MTPYMEGHAINHYASFMDYMGYACKLGLTNEWCDHSAPIDKDFRYVMGEYGVNGGKHEGDAVQCILKAVNEMKDGGYKQLPDSVVCLYLKWLVHFVPDVHCPGHLFYNFRRVNYLVKVDDSETFFHKIWDAPNVYGMHHWSSSEYCKELTFNLTKQQKKAMEMDGDIIGWVEENARNCYVAYDIVRKDDYLNDVDRYNLTVLADRQLVKGGVRLAYLLNMIFGK